MAPMINSSVFIPPESSRATNWPSSHSADVTHPGSQGDVHPEGDFKTLIDRRLNPKRPSPTSKRNSEKTATSKTDVADGKPTTAALASQTNDEMGMQGTAGEWRPSETLDQPNSGDDSLSCSVQNSDVKTVGVLPPDLSAVVPPEGDAPHLDPSGQARTLAGVTDQDKLAIAAPDDGETDDISAADGQKLPTSGVSQQAISAFKCADLSSPGGSSSAQTAGLQASTTSDNSQNALGTSVASVNDTMKSNKSSELPSRSLGRAQPRGMVDKASLRANQVGESSAYFRESSRLTPGAVAMLEPRLTESATSADDVPQNTGGATLVTVLHGISDQVLEFKKLGADSMAVLLKPDDRTEIYLSVKSQSGHIEVSARLNAGDADLLNVHWGEIKSSLAKQGIELSDLDTEDAHPHYGSTSSGGRHSQSPDEQADNPRQRTPNRRDVPAFITNIKSLADPLGTRWVAPVALAAAKRLWVMWI